MIAVVPALRVHIVHHPDGQQIQIPQGQPDLYAAEQEQRRGHLPLGVAEFFYWSHSTDKYRRVIWQRNSKFKDKTRCQTPHLTEDEIREAFIRVVNSLITDRKEVLTELRTVRDMLTGTEELEKEQKKLAEQMNVDADAVQNLIAENARVAQNQEEYTIRYDALVSRFEATKAEYEKTTADISARGIRRRELERFIQSVEKLPEMVTEFDEALWGSLVDHLTVNAKDDIVFTLTSGMEINA